METVTIPPPPWIGATADDAAAYLRAKRIQYPAVHDAVSIAALSLIDTALRVRHLYPAEDIADLCATICAAADIVNREARP